jgi:hypothetical protein
MAERKRRAPEPWEPVILDLEDPRVAAIRALSTGTANAGQQETAWQSILFDFCGIRDLSFRPGQDGARATDFAEGRRHVGLQLVKTAQLRRVTSKVRGEGPNAYPVGEEPAAPADKQAKGE